jgi:uncharacterized protein YcgI (DUF1989 family)
MTPYTHDVPGGTSWALLLPRATRLRLECLDDGANVSMLLFAARDPLERLNIPDTLKAQMSACVRTPMVLMSDLGRALCSVTGSSLDWHDAITGHSPETRGLLLDELATHGLGRRDLHACVNWFTKVAPVGDARGGFAFVRGHAATGDWLTLRAELDLLVVLATAPHPLDPSTRQQPAGVRASVSPVDRPADDDASRTSRPESGRALAAAERSAP